MARLWHQRDGLNIKNGSVFRADLPPGRYAVTVNVGHMTKPTYVHSVEANGVILGHGNIYTRSNRPVVWPPERLMHGIVPVGNDGLKVTVRGGDEETPERIVKWKKYVFTVEGPLSVLAIEAMPWAPAPVSRIGGKLQWTGSAPAPDGFTEAAKAYASEDFDEAIKAARKIENPLAQSSVLAWVLGFPNTTNDDSFNLCKEILAILQKHLAEKPDDLAAFSLHDATRRFSHGLCANLEKKATAYVFGYGVRRMYESHDYCVQIAAEEPYFGKAQLLAGIYMYWQYRQTGRSIQHACSSGIAMVRLLDGQTRSG